MSRRVIVTGAARGIGAAVARSLSEQGHHVALVDVPDEVDIPGLRYSLATEADLAATTAACGAGAISLTADVRDEHQITAAVATAIDAFGGLDAAVSAAGAIAGGAPVWETSPDVWQAMIDINLGGTWNLARAVVPHLLAHPMPRTGRFVAVASTAAEVGLPELGAYTVAKHGVAGLVRSLAADLAASGITANAVSPGSTDTDMLDATSQVYGLDSPADFAMHSRIERLLDPTEVAAAICWLCQPEASGITGAIVAVDGGFTG